MRMSSYEELMIVFTKVGQRPTSESNCWQCFRVALL